MRIGDEEEDERAGEEEDAARELSLRLCIGGALHSSAAAVELCRKEEKCVC